MPRLSQQRIRATNIAVTFPRIAAEWHPTRNRPLLLAEITPSMNKYVWWRCSEKKHAYSQPVNNRTTKKTGCPFCSGRYASPGHNLGSSFRSVAADWHPTKNKSLRKADVYPTWHRHEDLPATPLDITPGSNRTIWWRCRKDPIHPAWEDTVCHRTVGGGCPYCAGKRASLKYNLEAVAPELARELHPTLNGSLVARDLLPVSGKVVWWQCKTNGSHEWRASVANRFNGSGCPYCSGRRASADYNLTVTHPHIAAEWHPTENGSLKPDGVRAGSNRKAWWLCKRNQHHHWQAVVASRALKKSSCPHCKPSTSKAELRIYAEIQGLFRPKRVWHRKKVSGTEIDVYIRHLSSGIEYDGWYWHKDRKREDQGKMAELAGRGVKLVRVREKGLSRLADGDIMLSKKRDLSLPDMKRIVRRLRTISKLGRVEKKRVAAYLRRKTFLREGPYQSLLRRLPGPPIENSLETLFPKVAGEFHTRKNYPLTARDFLPGSHQHVWWVCEKGHDSYASIEVRTRPRKQSVPRCPFCAGRYARPGHNLADRFRGIAQEWHPTKNQPLRLRDVYPDWHVKRDRPAMPRDVTPYSNRRVWWRCRTDPRHVWQSRIADRTRSETQGRCPRCIGP